ncbi:MAG: hypothetical protein ACOC04_00795 [Halothece sp.]
MFKASNPFPILTEKTKARSRHKTGLVMKFKHGGQSYYDSKRCIVDLSPFVVRQRDREIRSLIFF